MRIAMLSSISWRTPPRAYGPWELVTSLLTEALVARGVAVTLFATLDDSTLAVPDRPGNNRVDSLRNIVRDPRVALLFLVPGAGETLRVNGRASISIAPDMLAALAAGGKEPPAVVLVSIESGYFQCSKALMRSKLWDPSLHVKRGALPSAGAMIAAVSESFDSAAYDAELPGRLKQSMY